MKKIKKMSFVKKAVAAVTMLAMTAGCMTGCGTGNGEVQQTSGSNYADTITLVWYPNESADTFAPTREIVADLVHKATGKTVEQKLTTDYAIAIEAVSSGTAQIGCIFGAEGYIQAKNANDAVELLVVESGASGTLDDAMYYSYLAVNEEDAAEYMNGDKYSIENIAGKKMSFVSNNSTSGFKVPTNSIISKMKTDSKWANLTVDDLMEGGSDSFFEEVLFGGSHQGAAFNLLSGKSDVSAFCDTEIEPYATCVSGEAKQAGTVYEINADADAPFDTVAGERFTVIASTPVMNGPFIYNSETLSPEDAEAIKALFTSDEVANDPAIFYNPDSEVKGLYKKTDNERFLTVEDSWYDPIRTME